MKVMRIEFAVGGKSSNEKVHGKPSSDADDSSIPNGYSSDAKTLPELLSTSILHCSVPPLLPPSMSQSSPENPEMVPEVTHCAMKGPGGGGGSVAGFPEPAVLKKKLPSSDSNPGRGVSALSSHPLAKAFIESSPAASKVWQNINP